MRAAMLVYNPRSGRQTSRRLVAPIVRELEAGGFRVEVAPTAGPGDATRLAHEGAEAGHEVIFAMGGDGTVREVAVGLLGKDAALGVLPAGTANVLAWAFNLPRNARGAAREACGYPAREIDVGLAGDVPFLMMVSCGLDAAVMGQQNPGLKKILGRTAIVLSALRNIPKYSYPQIELRVRGRHEAAGMVVVANVPYYAGRFRMAPQADFRDGRLDLVRLRGMGAARTLAFAVEVILARHLRRADVDVSQEREVEILGPPDLPVQIDGDALDVALPLTVSLASRRLRVLLPA